MAYEGGGELEWNSNIEVNKRAAKIIEAINDSRFRTTQFDQWGNPLAEAEEVLTHIIMLYKEISVELIDKEKEIWQNLKALRDKLRLRPPKPKPERMQYWQKSMDDIDELDLMVRGLAKKRGFLASNKRDITKAGLRR
jgi:hypothetical protein